MITGLAVLIELQLVTDRRTDGQTHRDNIYHASIASLCILVKSRTCHRVIVSTDIGAEFGDVRPLDAAHMRRLTVNGVKLLDLIDSSDAFVSELASPTVGVITWSQRQHLMEMVHSRDRNDKLLEFLTRRSVADFKKFTTVMSKYQQHLVPLLITDPGETFSTCR